MLVTARHLILKSSHYLSEMFDPATISTLERIKDADDGFMFTVDADHVKDMADIFFSTAAGRDLAYLKQQIIHYNIDWLEIIRS